MLLNMPDFPEQGPDVQCIGDTSCRVPAASEVVLRLCADRDHVMEHWGLCGSTANYLATFVARGLGSEPTVAASMVFNEIIENAVKYSLPGSRVVFRCWGSMAELVMEAENLSSPDDGAALATAMHEAPRRRTEALIEARSDSPMLSGVGLSSLIREHHVQLGTWLHRRAADVQVRVRVRLALDGAGDQAT